MLSRLDGKPTEPLDGVRRKQVERRGSQVECQQERQEPQRAARPERQRGPMRPVGAEARVWRRDAIDRIINDRHEHNDADQEGDAEPEKPLFQKCAGAFPPEARPHEQAAQEEHQVHQVDVLGRTEQVESEPACAVDDRSPQPFERGIERSGRLGVRAHVGDDGMEGHHHQDGEPPKIVQRLAGL
jgi:hypothetical protein